MSWWSETGGFDDGVDVAVVHVHEDGGGGRGDFFGVFVGEEAQGDKAEGMDAGFGVEGGVEGVVEEQVGCGGARRRAEFLIGVQRLIDDDAFHRAHAGRLRQAGEGLKVLLFFDIVRVVIRTVAPSARGPERRW